MRPLYMLLLFLNILSLNPLYAQEEMEHYKSIMKKGNVHLVTSVLIVNDLSWHRINSDDDEPGPLGIATGIDYCYTDSRFLSIQVGIANFTPFGEVIGSDKDGWHKEYKGSSRFINIRNNHVFRRFDFGYGLSLSNMRYSYEHLNFKSGIYKSASYSGLGLGGCISAYCRIAPIFFIGGLYQPQLISLSGRPIVDYKHTISLEAVFRANIGKTRMVQKKGLMSRH